MAEKKQNKTKITTKNTTRNDVLYGYCTVGNLYWAQITRKSKTRPKEFIYRKRKVVLDLTVYL